jgi:hypothetical protein
VVTACDNLKRLATFLDDGVDAFYKNKPSKPEVRLQGASARGKGRVREARGECVRKGAKNAPKNGQDCSKKTIKPHF